MGLFGYKNNTVECLSMKECYDYITNLLKDNKYIYKREYIDLWKKHKVIFTNLDIMKDNNVLSNFCKKNKLNFKNLLFYIDTYQRVNKIVGNHNESFIQSSLKSNKEYLDNILKDDDSNIILNEEQRRVVFSNEDYTLVVAGAGI